MNQGLKTVIVAILGAWLAVVICNGVNGDLGIVGVHASVRPSIFGTTVLHVPPLGSASARTHIGPARIDLSIDQVHIQQTADWLKQKKSPQETADLIENGMKRIAVRLACMAVIVAFLGAFVACVLFRTGAKRAVWGAVIGMLSVGLPLALAACTYNMSAFQNARFDGELARGPGLFDAAQLAWETNSGIVRDIPRIANRTANLCQQLQEAGCIGLKNSDNYERVLVISDLHNNPIAVQFARDIAKSYDVKLVLITGDFTDFGHPLEGKLLDGLKKFSVPVVGVTGNHDSRAALRALNGISGVTMLNNGSVRRICGLSIEGFGDPAARRADTGSVDDTPRQLRILSQEIARLGSSRKPDILMVHNNRVGADAAGIAPVIVDGHSHSSYIASRSGSVIINSGTAGAAGIRYFSSKNKPAYTAAILQFAPGRHPRLEMVDMIRMEMPSGDLTVTRKSIR